MNKTGKRIISIILVFAMMISIIPLGTLEKVHAESMEKITRFEVDGISVIQFNYPYYVGPFKVEPGAQLQIKSGEVVFLADYSNRSGKDLKNIMFGKLCLYDENDHLIMNTELGCIFSPLKAGENSQFNTSASLLENAIKTCRFEIKIDNYIYEFDKNAYQAWQIYNFYRNTDQGMNAYFSEDTPSQLLYNRSEENGLGDTTKNWTDLQNLLKKLDNPTNIPTDKIKERNIYEGIMFKILEDKSQDTKIPAKETIDAVAEMSSAIRKVLDATYGIKFGSDISGLSFEERKKLQQEIKGYLKTKFYVKADDFISQISEMVDFMNDFEDVCNYAINCMNVLELSETDKHLLKEMYENCPDDEKELKYALQNCVDILDKGIEELGSKIRNHTLQTVGVNLLNLIEEKFWEGVKDLLLAENPWTAWIWASYKASTFLCDFVFKTSDIAEQYVKLSAIVKTRSVLHKVYEIEKERYGKNRTSENAMNYLAAISMEFRYLDEDCDIAEKFVQTVSDAAGAHIIELFKKSDRDEVVKSIKAIRNTYKRECLSVSTSWINNLEDDYPEEYAKYSEKLSDEKTDVKVQYYIACPVDVYVKNKDGDVVASIINNSVQWTNNKEITVATDGDRKEIWFYGERDHYTLEYLGTDVGTMDITISQYNKEGIVERKVKYIDIDVQKDKKYVLKEDLENKKQSYKLIEEEKSTIYAPNVDSLINDIKQYKLVLHNGYAVKDGGGGYEMNVYPGEKIQLFPNVGDGQSFKKWIINLDSVSSSESLEENLYFIMPGKNVDISAIFWEKGTSSGGESVTPETPGGGSGESSGGGNATPETPSGGNGESSGGGNATPETPSGDNVAQTEDADKDKTKDNSYKIVTDAKQIAYGKQIQLRLKHNKTIIDNKTIVWKTSNSKYLTVDSQGRVKAKKAGIGKRVTITAKIGEDNFTTAKIVFTIMRDSVTKIIIEKKPKSILVGQKVVLKVNVLTSGKKANKKLKWKSSNANYVTVDSKGKIIAKKAGKGKTVTITATSTDGTNKKDSVKIRIK